METLSPYKLQIQYKPGKELLTADALSWLYTTFVNSRDKTDPD